MHICLSYHYSNWLYKVSLFQLLGNLELYTLDIFFIYGSYWNKKCMWAFLFSPSALLYVIFYEHL